MRHRVGIAALAALSVWTGAAAAAPQFAGASSSVVLQPTSSAATPAAAVASVPGNASIEFDVSLQLSDTAGAVAFERAVSDPTAPAYRHYLTPAEWEQRFSPSPSSSAAVTSWLRSQGITIDAVSADRMTVAASAVATTIERAFQTNLKEYRHLGKVVRLASAPLRAPANVAPLISAVTGLDQHMATPAGLRGAEAPSAPRTSAEKELGQPPGFRNAPPCSSYYGQTSDSTDPAYGGGYPSPLPYAVCGYGPAQFQAAYGLASPIKAGTNGNGVTVAVVDAYAAPTLLSDAQEYARRNQAGEPLASSQFSEVLSKPFSDPNRCEASEWFGEQTLDVEAVHATAPGAKIVYMGAKNCETGLNTSVQQVVDGHLAQIITDSWGNGGGDVLVSASSREAFDHILLMAAGTGISVLFSSGDEGDEFTTLGATLADYPPSSPYDTAVGGTSLQVGSGNARIGEPGWSTAKSTLCSPILELSLSGCSASALGTWLPPAPGAFLYGSGGGTSYEYPEPSYQLGVVPAALAQRNTAVTGIANRVEPDISMDGDPTTGMLVGETQTFPDGTYYDQYRIGGTSLSSPLFAGVLADAIQAAGGPLGFVNPALYKLDASRKASAAFSDIVPAGKQALVRVDYNNEVDGKEGTKTSVRVLGYQGPEAFCDRQGHCTEQETALSTAPGFDSMTGIGSPASGLIAALAKP
jgi:subtilase family serine protease